MASPGTSLLPPPPTTAAYWKFHKAKIAARRETRPITALFSLFVLLCASLLYFYKQPETIQTTSRNLITPVDTSFDSIVSVRAGGYGPNYCDGANPENFLKSTHRAWLVFLIPAVIFLFIGLAIVTDDYFVPALEQICEQLSLSEDVAGATFMAAGSSAPELFTALLGALWTKDDVGIGTIVGSAVFNILIIIGLSAALAKETLDLDFRPLLRDSAFYILSIIMLIIFVMFVGGHTNERGVYELAGKLNWWEGLIFVLAYFVYILFMAYGNKPYLKWAERFMKNPPQRPTANTEDVDSERPVDDIESVVPVAPVGVASSSAPGMSVPASPPAVDSNAHISSLQSALERRSSRYSELNPRAHMRVLTYAIMAAQPFQQTRMDNVDLSDNNHTTVPTGVGAGISSQDQENAAQDIAPQLSQDVQTIAWGTTKRPQTKLGWATLVLIVPWKLLYKITVVDCSKDGLKKWWPVTFSIAILWIMVISFGMVEATRLSGCFIGIPSAVMGLTFLAAGTSVPDALASVSVARNGFGNMAVSNAIGSNVFDIFLGLGLPWFIAGLALEEGVSTITVSPPSLIIGPIAVLFVVIVVLVLLLMFMKWRLSRKVGYVLFGLYGLFIIYSLLNAFVFAKEPKKQA